MQYVQVSKDANSDIMEIPSEDNGTLLLTTLSAQYPGACGLKYRSPDSGAFRGLRLSDGFLHPPNGNWGNVCYYVVYGETPQAGSGGTKRRVSGGPEEDLVAKVKRAAVDKKCSDLIVLGLSYACDRDQLEEYFADYGTVVSSEVKMDSHTGKSKGFGFVRFADYESQVKALAQRHSIAGRWCDVKLPGQRGQSQEVPLTRKIFVGRCTEAITQEILREYFEKFGEVTDVFIPQPFRGFGFVTFTDPHIAQALCGEDHTIGGVNCPVTAAVPKNNREQNMRGGRGGFDNFQGGRGGSGGGGYGNGYNARGGDGYSSSGSWTPRGRGGYDRGDRGGFNRHDNRGGYDRYDRGNDSGGYGGSGNYGQDRGPQQQPASAGGAQGGEAGGRDGLSSSVVEQMSSIMAAALTAATQNMGSQSGSAGQVGGATPTGGTSSSGGPAPASYTSSNQPTQRWPEQSGQAPYSGDGNTKGAWGESSSQQWH